LLELLSLLQTRPHWNGPELAERLGITERTVRRDITRLRQLGYPVVADAGRGGGYQLGRGGALPPLLLTNDESVAVAIGLRVAASGGVAGYDEAAVAALAKLEQMLPATLREKVLALNAATVVTRPGTGPLVDSEVLLTIAQACRRPERVRFGYQDGSGNLTERRVEPYGLVNAERRWYLVARDLDRRDWRTFRLDRLSDPVLTGHRFVRTEEPDTAAMVARGLSAVPYRWQAEVVLHTTLEDAESVIARTIGAVEEVAGEVILRFGANEVDWLARYLAGLPFDSEVRSPPEVRSALRDLGRRLQAANPARSRPTPIGDPADGHNGS
jgi:predicted DNA-binding transcriptional regulator YafY